jgi:hypothetical protein
MKPRELGGFEFELSSDSFELYEENVAIRNWF